MLDMKFVRDHMDLVIQMLKARNHQMDLGDFASLETARRAVITEAEALKQERNTTSRQIGALIKQGQDVGDVKKRVGEIGGRIKELDGDLRRIEADIHDLMSRIPNMLDPDTPIGKSEDDNPEVGRWGSPPEFDFEVKDHVAIGNELGILDFETAAKLTGSRFALLRGAGARLERALINFMIDVHSRQGYFEVLPPFIVNSASMYGTGQFPKMKEDVFQLAGTDYYLIPTAEVPVTNIHRDEILASEKLPVKYQAFTPCFRSEAGAHGKDTRGLIRQHQFNKVEMVAFVHPDESDAALNQLRDDAEEILRQLALPYRVVKLCSADISFGAQKCFDLEVWLPGQQRYREISSCSNFGDFQARRSRIRFKDAETRKNRLVHTLNGSGLAVGRTLVAILENYQCADGTVRVPEVLKPYMGGMDFLKHEER